MSLQMLQFSRVPHLFSLAPVLAFGRAILFALALCVPILVAAYSTGLFAWGGVFKRVVQDAPAFPKSRYMAPGGALKVAGSEGLNPKAGEDFVLVTWFSLRRLPEPGQRIIVVNKIDGPDRKQTGYALGLTNDAGSIRPMAFWRDGEGRGRWQTFAELPVVTRSWVMLALSFREGKLLGLHGGVRVPGSGVRALAAGELRLLGGYDLDGVGLPTPEAPLVVNPVGAGAFHGRLGLVGVLSGKDLGADLIKTLKGCFETPLERPANVDVHAVRLWTEDGR